MGRPLPYASSAGSNPLEGTTWLTSPLSCPWELLSPEENLPHSLKEDRTERASAGQDNELPLTMENFPWKVMNVIEGLHVAGGFLLICP